MLFRSGVEIPEPLPIAGEPEPLPISAPVTEPLPIKPTTKPYLMPTQPPPGEAEDPLDDDEEKDLPDATDDELNAAAVSPPASSLIADDVDEIKESTEITCSLWVLFVLLFILFCIKVTQLGEEHEL